jgi:hypothetical protein
MRGPGMRLGLDVRRLWQCPQCGAQRKLPADVTSVRCSACSVAPFMQIVEPPRRPRPAPKPLNPFLTIDLDTPEEGEERSPATTVMTAATTETVTVGDSAPAMAPQTPPGGPPPKRDDRRNKSRRQRDRHGKPDQPAQTSPASPPTESPQAVNTPDASPAPTPLPPDSPPAPNPSAES